MFKDDEDEPYAESLPAPLIQRILHIPAGSSAK